MARAFNEFTNGIKSSSVVLRIFRLIARESTRDELFAELLYGRFIFN